MEQNKEYFVFISYSSLDNEWAIWLRHELEHYHLPASFNGRTDVRDNLRKVFRDRDELSAGPEWDEQVQKALEDTNNLIVICSPHSAKSDAVNKEIETFIALGKEDHIFPFIVEGEKPEDCFPPALRHSKLGGDVNKDGGRDSAFIKVVAGMLKVSFPSLWNRYEIEKAEEERREREKRDRLLILESRYLSEKALDIAPADSQLAKMLLLKALPEKLNDLEDRPYCIEAESALRRICNYKSAIFKGHEGGVMSFKVNPSGNSGVTASFDGTVRIWDLETASQIREPLKGHTDSVLYATYSHDGKLIASCSKDCAIILWDAETGIQIGAPLKRASDAVKCLAFTHDDKQLIAASLDEKLRIWDVKSHQLVHEIPVHNSNDMAIDKDDKWVALASSDFSIKIFDLKEGRILKEIHEAHSESLSSIDFSPNGKRVVSASYDGKMKVWNWMNGEIVFVNNVGKVSGAYAPVVNSAKYSHDGNYIVTASRDRMIRIWNAKTGEQQGLPLAGHTDSVCSAFFNEDGDYVISASLDGTARIWDINPKVAHRIIGRARYIPFDTRTTSGNYFLEIKSCNIYIKNSENEIVYTLKGHSNNVRSAIFSPDGTKIASISYDGTARIWNSTNGKQIGPALGGHSDSIRSVAFSTDGRLLVTASENELKVWDVNQYLQLGQDITSFDDFYDVMFTKNGRGIIAETKDDYDILFDWLPLQELIDKTREQVKKRQFTDTEKKKYYLE